MAEWECQVCDNSNPGSIGACSNCGCPRRDSAASEAESVSRIKPEPAASAVPASQQWVITCPECHEEYLVENETVVKSECKFCSDDKEKYNIAHVRAKPLAPRVTAIAAEPEPAAPAVLFQKMTLEDKANGFTLHVSSQGALLGRQGDVGSDNFSEYTARKHCRISFDGSSWFVEHLSETNSTSINRIELPRGIKNIINDGDRLVIADHRLSVKIIDLPEGCQNCEE